MNLEFESVSYTKEQNPVEFFKFCLNHDLYINLNNNAAGTAVNACGGKYLKSYDLGRKCKTQNFKEKYF